MHEREREQLTTDYSPSTPRLIPTMWFLQM